MGETYYDVLGVERDASQEEIAAAYRRRALEVHPDRNDDPDATEQFTRLSTAESVLSDEAERARYDRLGHESYVRLARLSGGGAGDGDRDDGREESGAPGAGSTRAGGKAGRTGGRTGRGGGRTGGDGATRSRRKHRRRRGRTDDRRRSTGTSSRGGGGPFDRTAGRGAKTDPGGAGRGFGTDEPDGGESAKGAAFRYAVHDWTGDVDLDPRSRRLDRDALLTVAWIALLYPAFVFASLAPAFPTPVNAFVAACTLVFVGYLLTMPRVALATFGCWSLLVPLALVELPLFDPFSPRGMLAVAFVWVPLGYAVAVRWALRP